MNLIDENQHYVSRVLLDQFKVPGNPLHCYNLAQGEWKARSLEKACSARGYNQCIVGDAADNSFETCFSQIESRLPKIFRVLARAAEKESTLLEDNLYENLCKYCTLLKLSSPAAKACAVVGLTFQINWEVENNQRCLLRELQIPEDVVAVWKYYLSCGLRLIVESDNLIQLAFRVHYNRSCDIQYAEFLNCRWSISRAPIDLPMSDIGLIPIHFSDLKANYYMLPISPRLVLEGVHYFDQKRNSRSAEIRRLVLSEKDASWMFETICSSAVSEIISSTPDSKIPECLNRRNASSEGASFNKIVNLEAVFGAGRKTSTGSFGFRVVTPEEYRRFVHSFMLPPPSSN